MGLLYMSVPVAVRVLVSEPLCMSVLNPMCVLVYVVICVLERKSVLVSVHVISV